MERSTTRERPPGWKYPPDGAESLSKTAHETKGLNIWGSSAAPQLARGAQSPVEPTPIVAQQTLTNRSESPFSEIDFRLGDHQHLKGYFLDNSRNRLLR